jgi:hypothetical protein
LKRVYKIQRSSVTRGGGPDAQGSFIHRSLWHTLYALGMGGRHLQRPGRSASCLDCSRGSPLIGPKVDDAGAVVKASSTSAETITANFACSDAMQSPASTQHPTLQNLVITRAPAGVSGLGICEGAKKNKVGQNTLAWLDAWLDTGDWRWEAPWPRTAAYMPPHLA